MSASCEPKVSWEERGKKQSEREKIYVVTINWKNSQLMNLETIDCFQN